MEAAAWSRAENKIFEDALVQFPEEVQDRWLKIAGCLRGKTAYDVKMHHDALLHDVKAIEDGLIQLPTYPELPITRQTSSGADAGGSQSSSRKKGKPWTEEEHKLFLLGLEKYGRSDWRSISRNVVKTRLPSQVASHAQKYFIRQKEQEQDKKKRKRSSIHDAKPTTHLGDYNVHLSDPDSPHTPTNKAPAPLPYMYPSIHDQSPYTPGMSSNLVGQPPYTPNPNPINVGMSSNLYPSTVQSPYTLTNVMSVGMASNSYLSSEQSPYTPKNAGMVSNPYIPIEHSSYTTPSNTGMASNMYPATEQSPYATSNTYTSSEQSLSSTDSLPFGDTNSIDARERLALPETDIVVVVRPDPHNGESYPPNCFQQLH